MESQKKDLKRKWRSSREIKKKESSTAKLDWMCIEKVADEDAMWERESERNINKTTKQWNDIWELCARVWLLSNWVETINKAYWLKTLLNVYAVVLFCILVCACIQYSDPLLLYPTTTLHSVQIHFDTICFVCMSNAIYWNVCHLFHNIFFCSLCVLAFCVAGVHVNRHPLAHTS